MPSFTAGAVVRRSCRRILGEPDRLFEVGFGPSPTADDFFKRGERQQFVETDKRRKKPDSGGASWAPKKFSESRRSSGHRGTLGTSRKPISTGRPQASAGRAECSLRFVLFAAAFRVDLHCF